MSGTDPSRKLPRARSTNPPSHSSTYTSDLASERNPELWNPDIQSSPKGMTPRLEDVDEPTAIIEQLEIRPMSQEQLGATIQGIYAGLKMVESKCIEVDNAQSLQSNAKLNNEQWQALIALHRTLLHEHHDFLLVSQLPSASAALHRLASKYYMPARMWRHGIHSFLELLRHRLPDSLEHMLTFIYLAYSMLTLLYETVPAFEDTWLECLGDLGRYRMVIEDDDIRDREVWTSVSCHWYSKASDKLPTTGRLYHHLAILARPNALHQLFYYSKSLCVPIPFGSARESIMILFDPILNAGSGQNSRFMQIDVAFVKSHGIMFSEKSSDQFDLTARGFYENLDNHIGRITQSWMESGYCIGIANCCALLSYGKDENALMKAICPQRADEAGDSSMDVADAAEQTYRTAFEQACFLSAKTQEVVFHRVADPNILPYLHVSVVFMHHMTFFPAAMSHIDEASFPWKLLSLLLNSLLLSYREYHRIQSTEFPRPEKEPPRPLPEDFAMNGLLWVDKYFPNDWFSNETTDHDEKYFEVASMTDERKERILWLGCRIANLGKWLVYDESSHQFSVLPQYENDIETL